MDDSFPSEGKSPDELEPLLRNAVLGPRGIVLKEFGSVLGDEVYQEILNLSFEYMDNPDDVYTLAQNQYGPLIESDKRA